MTVVNATEADAWAESSRGAALLPPPEEERAAGPIARAFQSLPRDSMARRALGVADLVGATGGLLVVASFGVGLRPGIVLAIPVFLLLAKILGLYDRDGLVLRRTTLDEAPGIAQLCALYAVALWLAGTSVFTGQYDKLTFLVVSVSTFAATLAARSTARRLIGAMSGRERCLVVGDTEVFHRLRARLKLCGDDAAEAVMAVQLASRADEQALVQGGLAELVAGNDIDRVIISPRTAASGAVLELVSQARREGANVSVLPGMGEIVGSSAVLDEIPGTTLLAVRPFGLSRSSVWLKRGFDVIAAGTMLVVLAPLLAALALAVKLTSPGTVLYRQRRTGHGGRVFEMLKFRTMVHDADALKTELAALNEADGLFKIRDDPRRTRVGRWLRQTSLDELPQLFNVLRGDMSLVGPRPLVPEEDAQIYGWHRQRLDVPPGMTGHWQVLGSARVPLREMVVIDYLYIANWSLWQDVKCLLRTVPCVLGRRGL
jgi:exopolysaccharide biosynthesis polyprenyl glycosylphosphotransferase